jgi:hypothetical protein
MKKIINWIKENWYFYLLILIGLSFYLYMVLLRFLRASNGGPIAENEISKFRLNCVIVITIAFFILVLVFLRMIYRLRVPTNNVNSIIKWLQTKIAKVSKFYNEVLETTLHAILSNTTITCIILEYGLPYFHKFIRSYTMNIILIILVNGIPLIISICFLIDAYSNEFYYMPKAVIFIIIPLIIRSVLFTYNSSSKYLFDIWRKDFYIGTKKDEIVFFKLKENKAFRNCDTIEKHEKKLAEELIFCTHIYQVAYAIEVMWDFYTTHLYVLHLLICRLIMYICFFSGWFIISYYSLATYNF